MIQEPQQEPQQEPSGCLFWWYSFLAKRYKPEQDAWQELEKRGWYWYRNLSLIHI